MALTRWGFIYTLGPDAEEKVVSQIGSPGCVLIAVGVPSVDDAADAARELVADGVQLVELCGAFGAPGTAAVVAAVGEQVPVGGVFYGGEATAGLHDCFA